MADRLDEIKGVTADLMAKLKAEGIDNSDELLAAGAKASARRELSKKIGIESSAMLELVNRADLMRIKGVGRVFADMLEEAGVDSCKELARRRADNLAAKLAEINDAKKLTSRSPNQAAVEGWIAEAKGYASAVED